MKQRKGIILAGGTGSRLFPITLSTSKQLLAIYDKPMIYYSLSVLMIAGIRDILVITTPNDHIQFKNLLGNGKQWGISISYKTQPSPDGIAQSFILAEDFLDNNPSALILGDNIFYGQDFNKILEKAMNKTSGATVFGYHVSNPKDYGVAEFNNDKTLKSIIEKPINPPSNFAITGLYFVDESAPMRAKEIAPSKRGEIEITSLLNSYISDTGIDLIKIGRGFAWLDTGTHSSLIDAGNFVRTIIERQGQQVGSPDEIAYIKNWINSEELLVQAKKYESSSYGKFLTKLLEK